VLCQDQAQGDQHGQRFVLELETTEWTDEAVDADTFLSRANMASLNFGTSLPLTGTGSTAASVRQDTVPSSSGNDHSNAGGQGDQSLHSPCPGKDRVIFTEFI
jgi:hypothetical protein